MKLSQNTVLITGGSAGIGLALAKALSAEGNQVIITGRNQQRLDSALSQLTNAIGIVSDVSREADVDALVSRLQKDFPSLNMVINNAGRAFVYSLAEETDAYSKAAEEMSTNFLSVVRLNERLLPLLKKQPSAAIVNVSSIVAFAPALSISTYSSSKAALHSYSQALRVALSGSSNVSVFELMPPLVNTEFSHEIGGATKGIPASVVADALLNALRNDQYEIHVAGTADFYKAFHSYPEKAVELLNH